MKERLHPGFVTAGLLAGTAIWNVLQNVVVPRWTYTWFNAAGAIGALTLGRRLGLEPDELGSSPQRVRRGLAVGAAAGAVVAGGVAVAAVVAPDLFRDPRAEGLSAADVWRETAVRIPIGTALFEEALFRGLLMAWLTKHYGARRGLLWSSALFGIWHVLPTWEATAIYQDGSIRDAGSWQAPIAVLGGVVTRIGSRVFDGSLRTQLANLRKRMAEE